MCEICYTAFAAYRRYYTTSIYIIQVIIPTKTAKFTKILQFFEQLLPSEEETGLFLAFFIVALRLTAAKIAWEGDEDRVLTDARDHIPRDFNRRTLCGEAEESVGDVDRGDPAAVAVDREIADAADALAVADIYDVLFAERRVVETHDNITSVGSVCGDTRGYAVIYAIARAGDFVGTVATVPILSYVSSVCVVRFSF